MIDTKFEVGDTVSWMGAGGIVEELGKDKSLLVYFPTDDCRYEFYPDGRLHDFHTEPSLKLIHKAKNKITIESWVTLFRHPHGGFFQVQYSKEEYATAPSQKPDYITTVHLSKEIEI